MKKMKNLAAAFLAGLACGNVMRFDSPFTMPLSTGESVLMSERKTFAELLIQSGSDKFFTHHYQRYYEKWLAPYRQKENLKLLEIGANEGHSLKVWASYFDNNPDSIVGLAYSGQNGRQEVVNAGKYISAKRDKFKSDVLVLEGDQSDPATMKLLRHRGPWDIIIDDGSHVPKHVLFSLFSLWPNVKPGGLYVIEDIETSYWKANKKIYGYKLRKTGFLSNSKNSVAYKLKEILDVLVRHQLGLNSSTLSIMPQDSELCSVTWGMNIVALHKCGVEDGTHPPTQPTTNYDTRDFTEWLEKVRETNPNITYS